MHQGKIRSWSPLRHVGWLPWSDPSVNGRDQAGMWISLLACPWYIVLILFLRVCPPVSHGKMKVIPSVMGWIRIVSIDSYIWMCSHQGVEMFEKIRRIRRCGLVGRRAWGLEFPKPHQAQASLFACLTVGQDVCSSQLFVQHHAYCHVTHHNENELNLWNYR